MVDNPFDRIMPLNEFLKQNEDLISDEFFYLKLTKSPMSGNPFKVNVKISLSTGEVYEAESTMVTIVP